jgi:Flp pilus assembly pilin Flp
MDAMASQLLFYWARQRQGRKAGGEPVSTSGDPRDRRSRQSQSRRGNPAFANVTETSQMNNMITRFVREEAGQDLIEYSLLAALISVASIAFMTPLSTQINAVFTAITAALTPAP